MPAETMLRPSETWATGSTLSMDQLPALRILDETGGLSAETGLATQQASRGARTLPAAAMGKASHLSPADARWKNAGEQTVPGSMKTGGPLGAKTSSHPKKKLGPSRYTRKMASKRKINHPESGKPARWSDVLNTAEKAEQYSEWNDLLAGVGFGDTMQRLSSYYQNNAILAGLLAGILFETMSGGRLFDLERGTLTCLVSGPEPCKLRTSQYGPQELEVSHYVF